MPSEHARKPHASLVSMNPKSGASLVQRKCACGGSAGLEGMCEDCRGKRLQRRSANGADSATAPPIVHEVLRSPGQPLDQQTRAFFEPRFGHDFSKVRVHTDARAAESARAVNALAYTVGRDLVFGTGQHTPGTVASKRLLAHELTHSIQQAESIQPRLSKLEIAHPQNSTEGEAETASRLIMSGQTLLPISRSPIQIARRINEASSPTPENGTCGPDVADWFVSRMNAAKTDPQTLNIKQDLDGARQGGARYGYSATDVLEGGVARKVIAAERAAGNPQRTTEASGQLAAADSQNQFGRALLAAAAPIPFVGAPEQMLLGLIKRASLKWKNLVQTGAVWDFKSNVLSGANLAALACPNPCPDPPTITMCDMCFEHDLPGNLFYAYIGGYCGFSLNALQLGSQFAELQANSSSNWDTPEDTAAINLGFNLPANITRTNLCSALSGAGSIRVRNCTPCPTTFSPAGVIS